MSRKLYTISFAYNFLDIKKSKYSFKHLYFENICIYGGFDIMNLNKLKKFKIKGYKSYDNLTGYLYISPWLLGLICFTVIPILMSFYYSFTSYDMLSVPEFIGMENYANILFNDGTFRGS